MFQRILHCQGMSSDQPAKIVLVWHPLSCGDEEKWTVQSQVPQQFGERLVFSTVRDKQKGPCRARCYWQIRNGKRGWCAHMHTIARLLQQCNHSAALGGRRFWWRFRWN